jgi:uncharacterized protein
MAQASGDEERAGAGAGSAASAGIAVADMPAGLAALIAEAGQTAKPRPVQRWNPPFCGDIDMRVAADGTWFYGGTPVGREALMRLFASILRCEPDGSYVLVTPVEKVGIRVADAPFLAVEMTADGDGEAATLMFRTNVGDVVGAGPINPLRFAIEAETGGLKAYLLVRGRLEALVSRMVMHDLVEAASTDEPTGRLGVWSGGAFFAFPEANGA